MSTEQSIELERKSVKPLYSQIYDHIYDQINYRIIDVGDQLPTEMELAEKYKVGRITIRHAIGELAREGLLIRKAGKGTFVAPHKIERELINVTSFTSRMEAIGLHANASVISQYTIDADHHIANELKIEEKSPVLYIIRLRFTNGTPVALEKTYISLGLCPGLDEIDLNNRSLYEVLNEQYELKPSESHKTLELAFASSWEAEQLNTIPRAPLFLMRATVYTKKRPLEYMKSLMRGDKFRFQI